MVKKQPFQGKLPIAALDGGYNFTV